jgi:hypothetical protein
MKQAALMDDLAIDPLPCQRVRLTTPEPNIWPA